MKSQRVKKSARKTYQEQLAAVIFGGAVVGEKAFAFRQHVACVFGDFGNWTEWKRDYTSQFTRCRDTANIC